MTGPSADKRPSRWPVRAGPVIGVVYLVLVIAPYYCNGIFLRPLNLIGTTNALDPRQFVPFSLPGGSQLLSVSGGLAILGLLVLPILAVIGVGTLLSSDWPKEATQERRREWAIQVTTVFVPVLLFFASFRGLVTWYMD